MKFLGLERDNTTLLSSPDPLGWEYSASFELYPFHEGKDRAVYKGIMNGRGPKRGSFCVVKAKLDTTAVAGDWKHVQESVRCAISLATSFNVLVNSRVISFVWPKVAQMATISDFTPIVRLFKPHDKHLKKEEVVVLEDFLDGDFETYSSTVGWAEPHSKADITQAFSHFTWHSTRSLVVCGLQGVAQGRGFRLTTPTIHSRDRKYGESDGGLAGVMEFFSSHRCNNICSAWAGPDVPDIKYHRDLNVHQPRRQCNRPRRDCNVYVPPHESHGQDVPKVPSAPIFDSTRF